MARTLAYRAVDSQGQPVAGCPVVIMTRTKGLIPGSEPPTIGRYVLGTTVTAVDGAWSFEADVDGPLMAVAWDPARLDRRPMVIEPIMG
ncbi:hypothetical protein [Pseudaeromonas pectinilytica]